MSKCICHSCIKKHNIKDEHGMPLDITRMICCPKCGNKRCPKATNHRNDCTNSNETNQKAKHD